MSKQVLAVTETWVVLGDSISAGYGVPLGKGWVSLVDTKLKRSGRSVTLLNESISGDTTAGGLARLPEVLERIKPTKVIIELGGNDGLRGLSPKSMQQNLSAMVQLCLNNGADVVLLGMKIPPNYGQKYATMFENVFLQVAKTYEVTFMPFFLDGVGGFEKLMQADGIHPNVEAQQVLANNAWSLLAMGQ